MSPRRTAGRRPLALGLAALLPALGALTGTAAPAAPADQASPAAPADQASPRGGFLAVPRAGAQPLPQSPGDETSRNDWVNPLARVDEEETDLEAEVVSVTGAGRVDRDTDAKITVELVNRTDRELAPASLTPRRAGAVADVAEARTALAQDRDAYAPVGETVRLDGPLGPGARAKATVTVPAGAAAGVYPVAVEVRSGSEVTSERLLLDVTDSRAASDAAGSGAADADGTADADANTDANTDTATDTNGDGVDRAPVSVVVPVTEPVNIVPGETGEAPEDAELILQDESLARSMAPGGRLEQLLGAVEHRRDALGPGLCLAVDPALVDAAARMSTGYTVSESRGSQASRQRRLRDSWGGDDDAHPGVPGTGAEAAREWLERLSRLASRGCVAAMPWANADVDAVARTGDPWLMREALQRGPDVLRERLGARPQTDLVLPGSGFLTPQAAPAMAWADLSDEGTDIEAAWERARSAQAQSDQADTGESTLDQPGLPDAGRALPGPPEQPVTVLVADNTVWDAPRAGRFASLAPGVRAVTHQGSLSATLAALGPAPVTTGYSNPDSRFDYRLDSPAARRSTAASAVDLATRGEEPVLVNLPAAAPADAVAAVLDAAVATRARPVSLDSYVRPDDHEAAALADAAPASAGLPAPGGAPGYGAPFPDPGAYADSEVIRASQQVTYTDDLTRIMDNDPAIALTRYGFTAPLRRDVLASLTVTGRRSIATFDAAARATGARLDGNRAMLQDLRSSVELVPPGNVYTRSSESSPLLIVARNGLPLPARTRIEWSTPDAARLNTPEQVRIPARGSMTVQMTADIPDSTRRTDLELWLATVDGAAISNRVQITVQTRTALIGLTVAGVALAGAVALAAMVRVGRHRRR